MIDKSYFKELNFFKKFNELIECEHQLLLYCKLVEEDNRPIDWYEEQMFELENKIQELRKELNLL